MNKTELSPNVFALTGASSTGKSTLFEALREKYQSGISFVDEAARIYYEMHVIPKNQRGSYENTSAIQDLYFKDLELAIQQGNRTIVTDSSLLSGVAYAMQRSTPNTVEKLRKDIEDKLGFYSLFLLLNPNDIDYRHDRLDPVRMETEAERMEVHQNLLTLLSELNLHFEFISGTVEERVNKFCLLLEQFS